MMLFIISIILPIMFAIVTFFFLYRAFKHARDKSNRSNFLAAIGSLVLTIYFGINIKPPIPVILPLDNDTRIYSDSAEITIESGGFDIYYSLDGSDPKNGRKYENPIIITNSTTVSARSKFLWRWSDIVTRAYVFPEETSKSTQTPQSIPDSAPQPIETPTPEPTPELISIMNISEFYSDGIGHSKCTIKDNIGNTYNGYTYMVAGDFWIESEGSAVYRNDNQYNRFKGWVIIDDIEKNDEDCGWIKIYGDDSLLFDTGTMGRGIEPKDFDLDISTYTEIKIVFKNGNFASKAAKYAQCYLVETYFEEKNR